MKKLLVLSLLIVAGQVAAWGQTVNIHMKDGSVLKYDASGVDYVNFSAESTTPEEHEAVDLGLPSGLKWAACNIGATKPEETGYYICWGELEVKEECGGNNYKWRNSIGSITKYNDNNSGVLELEDDAANVLWGGSWRYPTKLECQELVNKCKRTATTQNGVQGYLFTGPNGNSIFLPTCGFKSGKEIKDSSKGYYWTRDVDQGRRSWAQDFYLTDFAPHSPYQVIERWNGLTIRAVTSN